QQDGRRIPFSAGQGAGLGAEAPGELSEDLGDDDGLGQGQGREGSAGPRDRSSDKEPDLSAAVRRQATRSPGADQRSRKVGARRPAHRRLLRDDSRQRARRVRDRRRRQESGHHRQGSLEAPHAACAEDQRQHDDDPGEGRARGSGGCNGEAAEAADAVISGSRTTSDGGGGGGALPAAAIAEDVGGRLVGNPGIIVNGVAPLDRASERDLSFLGAAKYTAMFASSSAGVVLVSPELAESPGRAPARVVVDRPLEALL